MGQKDLPGLPPTLDSAIESLIPFANKARATMLELARSADKRLPVIVLANAYRIAHTIDRLIEQLNELRPE